MSPPAALLVEGAAATAALAGLVPWWLRRRARRRASLVPLTRLQRAIALGLIATGQDWAGSRDR